MKIEDIFIEYNSNPKCLYCLKDLRFLYKVSDQYCSEYDCQKCNEYFAVEYNNFDRIPHIFRFSIYKKNIIVSLDEELISILNENVTSQWTPWLPLFKLDFSDKIKLHKKINTILTFL